MGHNKTWFGFAGDDQIAQINVIFLDGCLALPNGDAVIPELTLAEIGIHPSWRVCPHLLDLRQNKLRSDRLSPLD